MKVTNTETLDVQMVEFDKKKRYMRQYIPSQGIVAWFEPVGSIEEFSLKMVQSWLPLELEWKKHLS